MICESIVLTFKICAIKPFKKKVIISLTEHIGDIIAAEPISRKFPNQTVVWVINKKYSELIKYNPNINYFITTNSLSEWILSKTIISRLKKTQIIDLHIDEKRCSEYNLCITNKNRYGINIHNYYQFGSLLHIFCLISDLIYIDESPVYYINNRLQYDIFKHKYIVIQTTSNEKVREWDYKSWENLIKDLLDQFNITIIEIGLKSPLHFKHPHYHNLCGNKSFNELAALIKNATLFIGIDSSFAHFSNALNIPSIILLGKLKAFNKYNPFSGITDHSRKPYNVIHHEDSVFSLPHYRVYERASIMLKSLHVQYTDPIKE